MAAEDEELIQPWLPVRHQPVDRGTIKSLNPAQRTHRILPFPRVNRSKRLRATNNVDAPRIADALDRIDYARLAVTDELFSLRIDGLSSGPFTEPELVEWLEGYRSEHPDDDGFTRVKIHELPDHGTAGHHRSPWDFVTRPGS